MKQHTKQGLFPFVFLFFFLTAQSQAPAYNQNSARSNYRSYNTNSDGWNFGINSGSSFGVNSNEKTLFRGNSMASKMFGRYYFGKAGIGISSGFVPGAISDNALNNFLTERKLERDQVQIATGKPFNGYLAFGPGVRFGNRVQIAADLQGGMFLNNPGNLSITQLGVQRATYRFDGAGKNFYPGFAGTINIVYPLSSSTQFFIATDYLQSKSSIRIVDITRGIDVPAEQTRNVKLFTAGIGITKSFGTKREAGSGMATGKRNAAQTMLEEITITRDIATGQASGKRVLPTVNKREISIDEPGVHVYEIITSRDIATGQASGKRVLPTVNKREISIDEPGVHRILSSGKSNAQFNPKEISISKTYQPGQPVYGNRITNENCGPVTITKTNPDGSVEEMKFACPDDAAAFIVNSHGTPGTEVNKTYAVPHVLEQKGIINSEVAARNILAGRITWSSSPNDNGIVTNKSAAVSSVSNMGGGAASAGYARNGVATGAGAAAGAPAISKGIVTNIYAREAGSGMATGKRSRERGSGMSTGRRQYEPVFFDGGENNCTNCVVTAKENPLYNENGNIGTNPLYRGNDKMTAVVNNDCGGVSGLSVYLIDINTNVVMAKTQTETCGDFWFANIPSGNYVVNITGGLTSKKGYDAYMTKNADVAGEILTTENYWTLDITTDTGSVQDAQALIKTKTKSNQSNDRLVNTSRSNIKNLAAGIADLDGDGLSEIIVGSGVNSVSQGASLLGGALPGGAVISAALHPGDPIPGLDVKIFQNTNQAGNTQTNEYGEFEFTGLNEGNYTIAATINYKIQDQTIITLGHTENIITSESNLRRGDVKVTASQNTQSLRTADNGMPNNIPQNVTVPKQTQGATFGEKVKTVSPDMEPDLTTTNKTVNTSRSNIKNMIATLDELDQMLDADNTTAKSIINTSRSNIKNQRAAISSLEQTLNTLETMDKKAAIAELNSKMAAMNMQFLALQKSLDAAGKQYTTISNVLKTKHDTVKNSIGNIR